jgi:hypothetical protein
MTRSNLSSSALFLLLTLWGCGDEDVVIARVGDRQITANELLSFEARLPEQLRSQQPQHSAYRTYLQDMIDKELLVTEARQRRLQDRPEVSQRLVRERREWILREYVKREVYDRITVTDDELYDHQVATHRDRAVKVRRIVVATRAEAEQIIDALRSGAEFKAMADRNLLPSTLLEGGDYLIRDNLQPRVLEKEVFPLAVGEISEPVEYAEQFGVYQVVDESPMRMESIRGMLLEEIYKKRVPPMLIALITRLRDETGLVRHDKAHEHLVERLKSGRGLNAQERAEILYEHNGGTFSAGEFIDHARELKVRFGTDAAARANWFAQTVIEPRILMLEGARAAGIKDEAAFIDHFSLREESLLLVEMRRAAVSGVLADETEAHRFYEEHPRYFLPLEQIKVQEVLVASEEEAAAMRRQIEAGEDMGELAEQHTLRLRAQGREGIFHIHPFQENLFGEIFDAAHGMTEQSLVGPLAVSVAPEEIVSADPAQSTFYSVFRLLESTIGAAPEPFAKVGKRAKALARKVKLDKAFHQFLLDLRYRHRSQIEVFDDHLVDLAG